MSNQQDGGPAFPMAENGREFGNYHGMTLRDWFAGMALQGTAANLEFGKESWKNHAEASYKAADAMLAARERKEEA